LPPFTPGYLGCGIRCCSAGIIAVRGGDFGAGGGVDLFDDDRKLDPLALGFIGHQGPVNLAKDGVGGKEDARLEGLEKELPVRGLALLVDVLVAHATHARTPKTTM
jgi:hypothetical protein